MPDSRRPGDPSWEPADLDAEPTQVSAPSHLPAPRPRAPVPARPAPQQPPVRPAPQQPSRPAAATPQARPAHAAQAPRPQHASQPAAAPRAQPHAPHPHAPHPHAPHPHAPRGPAEPAHAPSPSGHAPHAHAQSPNVHAPHAPAPSAPHAAFQPPPSPFTPAPPFGAGSAPAGLVQKAPGAGNTFTKKFTGTVMGTMVFLAKTKSVPLAAKIGGVVILVGAIVATTIVLLQMRDREEARVALEAALALPDAQGVSRVRELAAGGLDERSMVRAIAFLGRQRDAQAVPLLIEALDGSLEVQRAAAGALAEIGPPAAQPAAEPLASLLQAEDASLQSRAAWALARLEDARGVDAVIEALATGSAPSLPSYDAVALARLLHRDGLLAALAHPSASVRQFAAYHLGEYCQAGDEQALSRVATDADASVANTAIVTLARCAPSAAPPHVASALAGGADRWNALYTQMRDEVGAPGLGMLLPHAPDPAARTALFQEIARSFDPRAGEVLAAELARLESPSARERLDAAGALAASSDPRVVEVLEPLLAGESDHARAAIALLGASANGPSVEPRLLAIATSRSALRPAAIDAMASAGACSDAATQALTRLVSQRDVRAPALRALGRCRHARAEELARREAVLPLAAPITAEQGEYRLAALDAVRSLGLVDLAPALFTQLEDASTDGRVRLAIADVLGAIAPDPLRDRALDRMMDAQASVPVRAAAKRMLHYGPAPSSVPRLLGFVRGGADDDRTRDAAILLGLARHADSREEVVRLLGDERARRHAALSLSLSADAEGAAALAALVQRDEDVQSRLARDLRAPPWTFARGREAHSYPWLAAAVSARDAGFGLPFSRLCEALAAPPEEGIGLASLLERRRALLRDLTENEDATTRALAAEALACSGARSAVLFARDRRALGAEEARRALSHAQP